RVLLDHQLRLLLRLAAGAAVPAPLRPRRGLRHPRRAAAHRRLRLLARPPPLRARPALGGRSARLPQGGAQRPGLAPGRRQWRRPGGARVAGAGRGHAARLGGARGRRPPGRVARILRLRDHGLPRPGRGDRRRRRRRLDAARPRPRRPPRCRRGRRARGAADPDRVRAGDAVLVAVRPEGLDLDHPGPGDGDPARGRLVAELADQGRRADAGAEPAPGDAADPVQQPGPVPDAAAHGLPGDGLAAHGLGHRHLRRVLDRGRRAAAVDRRRRRGLAGVAEPALPAADLRRGAGLGHRARIRLQPGADGDEGRDHGVLVPHQHLRQPVGVVDQCRRAQRRRHRRHRQHGTQRERLPDVLLRRVRVRGRGGVRRLCPGLPDAGPLPRDGRGRHVSGGGPVTLLLLGVTALVSWLAFGNRRLLERLLLWPPAVERQRQYDRLVTHGFVHADWQHLLFNMVTLYFFGRHVERLFAPYIGPVGYALFYLSAILVAILPTWMRHRHDAGYRSLGASGAVSAVL